LREEREPFGQAPKGLPAQADCQLRVTMAIHQIVAAPTQTARHLRQGTPWFGQHISTLEEMRPIQRFHPLPASFATQITMRVGGSNHNQAPAQLVPGPQAIGSGAFLSHRLRAPLQIGRLPQWLLGHKSRLGTQGSLGLERLTSLHLDPSFATTGPVAVLRSTARTRSKWRQKDGPAGTVGGHFSEEARGQKPTRRLRYRQAAGFAAPS
jgi:hypothetical protein